MMDLFLLNMQLFASQDVNWHLEWCGLLVDYCNVFVSCLDSHSDGTHSLQGIHWWASNVMLNLSKSDGIIYILEGLESACSAICHLWVNYSSKGNFDYSLLLFSVRQVPGRILKLSRWQLKRSGGQMQHELPHCTYCIDSTEHENQIGIKRKAIIRSHGCLTDTFSYKRKKMLKSWNTVPAFHTDKGRCLDLIRLSQKDCSSYVD